MPWINAILDLAVIAMICYFCVLFKRLLVQLIRVGNDVCELLDRYNEDQEEHKPEW